MNIILLFSNIFFLQKNKTNYQISFKNSEFFIINLFKKSYQFISSYLQNKYNINNQMNNIDKKKVIKFTATGLYNEKSNINWLKQRISNNFILEYDDLNPDYIIYNVFNDDNLKSKYQNIIRIAIYTENEIPNLNSADYSIAFNHINYLDRYFKNYLFPNLNLSIINEKRLEALNKPMRKKFCAAIISNCAGLFRLDFINKLNKYKKVDMGGKCYNNLDGRIQNKVKFLKEYKFSIAMENSEGDGYITEKIIDSFLSGTIQIYYGGYLVDEFINPKTYILIKGEKDIDRKIKYIKKIDNDDKLYWEIMKEKPIINETLIENIDKIEIKEFLNNIFAQDKNKAYRRDDNFYNFNPDLICQ